MPTLAEINEKRKELGVSAMEAKNALSSNTPSVPPVTQVIPPTTTLGKAQAMRDVNGGTIRENVAKVEGNIGTQVIPPAPEFTQAPVDPTTGLSKPLEATPSPVAPVIEPVKAPEPVKTEPTAKTDPVVDYNISAGREGDIQDNIAKITQTNPNLLKDRNAYNQAFGYKTADPGKKALLDSTFSGQVKPSQDDIFNSMRAGVTVGELQSTEFRQAQARIATFKKFSTYDTASLATSLQSGDLLVGTKAYNDLVSDPTMSAKIQKAQAFNKGVVDLAKIGETQTANIMASNPTVANALADNFISETEYNQLTNNAEVSAQLQKVETNKTKYETIKAQYDAVEDDVNTEFEGKEVTDSFRAKVAADRRKGMYKDYQIASLEYQNALGTYTNLKADATALLGQNMDLYKTAQAEKAQIAGEERQMKNQLALSQAQFDQKIAQQAQSIGTPELAIPDVIDQYAQLGVMASVSPQEHIARAKQFIANGGTLGEYISQMQKDFQSKDAYKAKFAPKATEYGFSNIGDGRIAITNPKTGQVSFANAGSVSSTNAPTTTSAKMLDIPTGTDVGVQCGTFARQLCGLDATPGGNSLEARQKAFSDTTPTAGGMVLFTGGGYDKTYGHIASIESVNQDGTINIVESNLNGDNKVTRRTLQANDPAISGFYNNTPLAKQGTGTPGTKEFSDSDIAVLGSVTKLDKQGKDTLKENGFTERDWANFSAGLLPPTKRQKADAEVIVGKVDDIFAGDWTDAVGTLLGKSRIFTGDGSDRRVTELKVNALKDLLAMANLDKIKGAMSDKDIEFLRNTATYLSTELSESEFEKTLNDIKNKYSGIVGGVPTTENIAQAPTQPTPTNTGVGQTNQVVGKQTYTWQ